jgi:hypothetical protein
MPQDALDPGPRGDYPYFPRLPDGSPAWADLVPAGYTGSVVRRGVEKVRVWGGNRHGDLVAFDVTPRDAAGNAINPPVIPPV